MKHLIIASIQMVGCWIFLQLQLWEESGQLSNQSVGRIVPGTRTDTRRLYSIDCYILYRLLHCIDCYNCVLLCRLLQKILQNQKGTRQSAYLRYIMLDHKNISDPIHFSNIMRYNRFWTNLSMMKDHFFKIVVIGSGSSQQSYQFVLVTQRTCPQIFYLYPSTNV